MLLVQTTAVLTVETEFWIWRTFLLLPRNHRVTELIVNNNDYINTVGAVQRAAGELHILWSDLLSEVEAHGGGQGTRAVSWSNSRPDPAADRRSSEGRRSEVWRDGKRLSCCLWNEVIPRGYCVRPVWDVLYVLGWSCTGVIPRGYCVSQCQMFCMCSVVKFQQFAVFWWYCFNLFLKFVYLQLKVYACHLSDINFVMRPPPLECCRRHLFWLSVHDHTLK